MLGGLGRLIGEWKGDLSIGVDIVVSASTSFNRQHIDDVFVEFI
jgi:hypothetical protein